MWTRQPGLICHVDVKFQIPGYHVRVSLIVALVPRRRRRVLLVDSLLQAFDAKHWISAANETGRWKRYHVCFTFKRQASLYTRTSRLNTSKMFDSYDCSKAFVQSNFCHLFLNPATRLSPPLLQRPCLFMTSGSMSSIPPMISRANRSPFGHLLASSMM